MLPAKTKAPILAPFTAALCVGRTKMLQSTSMEKEAEYALALGAMMHASGTTGCIIEEDMFTGKLVMTTLWMLPDTAT